MKRRDVTPEGGRDSAFVGPIHAIGDISTQRNLVVPSIESLLPHTIRIRNFINPKE